MFFEKVRSSYIMWSQSWVNFSVYQKTMISIDITYNKQRWWYQSLSLFTFACVNVFYEWQTTMKLLINIYYKLLYVLTRPVCILVLVSFIISVVTYFTLFIVLFLSQPTVLDPLTLMLIRIIPLLNIKQSKCCLRRLPKACLISLCRQTVKWVTYFSRQSRHITYFQWEKALLTLATPRLD